MEESATDHDFFNAIPGYFTYFTINFFIRTPLSIPSTRHSKFQRFHPKTPIFPRIKLRQNPLIEPTKALF